MDTDEKALQLNLFRQGDVEGSPNPQFCEGNASAHSHQRRVNRLRREYGLSEEDHWRAQALRQGCDICGREDARLVTDHDHHRSFYYLSAAVRGFLCDPCNRALGHFKDDARAIHAGAMHLRAKGKYVVEALGRQVQYRKGGHRGGLSEEEFNLLLQMNGGSCWTCGGDNSQRRLEIDHDHTTGWIRGLLCQGCNSGLGQLGDDPERAEAAAEFIRMATDSVGGREIGAMVRMFMELSDAGIQPPAEIHRVFDEDWWEGTSDGNTASDSA